MILDFEKENVVLLLCCVRSHSKESKVIADLLRRIDTEINRHNQKHVDKLGKISRATLYNYLKDLEEFTTPKRAKWNLEKLAETFCADVPRAADKMYRKFTAPSFRAMNSFLVERKLLSPHDAKRALRESKEALFYSFGDFLGVDDKGREAAEKFLSGTFKAYRPSLSAPGNVLISGAAIDRAPSGALRYRELMNFKSAFGWRRQFLEGYIVSKGTDSILITRDTSTRFAQLTVLRPVFNSRKEDGSHAAEVLAGSYSGITQNRQFGVFATGICLVRQNCERFQKYPLDRLKLGLMPGFGLVPRETVAEDILRYMFESEG